MSRSKTVTSLAASLALAFLLGGAGCAAPSGKRTDEARPEVTVRKGEVLSSTGVAMAPPFGAPKPKWSPDAVRAHEKAE